MAEQSRLELTWQADLAVLLALLLHLALPTRFVPGSEWTLVGVELLLLATFYATGRGRRSAEEPTFVRTLRVALIAFIALANFASLGLLLDTLLAGTPVNGRTLVFSAIQIWAINVIAFALWYWEWDRGGPGRRSQRSHVAFRFPQDEERQDWQPAFFDYFYVSFTNSAAFSPTDAMPMEHSTKLLMMLQALASLVTVALIVGRAVNILR
jgi:hypothetical protein